MADPRPPRLVVLCGLSGSGKTTTAKALAPRLGAIRMVPDEWITMLGADLYDQPFRQRVEDLQWTIAHDLLAHGQSVIIEWGVWSKAERDVLHARARELGVAVELRYLDVPIDEIVDRVTRRNAEPPWATAAISEEDLRSWVALFEPPTADELAKYDPPAD